MRRGYAWACSQPSSGARALRCRRAECGPCAGPAQNAGHARQAARIGFAPYEGDYGDLHTWLMLQVENQPEAETPTVITPLVRFFYDVQLLEVGYTPESEELMLNWIVRF